MKLLVSRGGTHGGDMVRRVVLKTITEKSAYSRKHEQNIYKCLSQWPQETDNGRRTTDSPAGPPPPRPMQQDTSTDGGERDRVEIKKSGSSSPQGNYIGILCYQTVTG